VASVLVATIPVWTAITEILLLRSHRFTERMIVALALGLGGVALIALTGASEGKPFNLLACLAILGSEISWSLGSVLSKRLALPQSKIVISAAEMLYGGLMLLGWSFFAGQLTPLPHLTRAAGISMAYMIVAGSLVAFTAYTWLLGRMPATKVASYAYVNPVVALAMGHWMAGEVIGKTVLIGSTLVIGSVILILTNVYDRRPGGLVTE
jgi:drug/metabolite transporter (DMT)-like permease